MIKHKTVHETTSDTPFDFMFGLIPRLLVDIMFQETFKDPFVTYSTQLKLGKGSTLCTEDSTE